MSMIDIGTTETKIKHDHLQQLRQFLEQIELEEYYTLMVEKLKVRDREKEKRRKRKRHD